MISPLLANLFLHYAFDHWLTKYHPKTLFERYADDAIVHCRTRAHAEQLLEALRVRLADCGLELNLRKTRIVYCKDANRTQDHEHEKFTFLGYEFRARTATNRRSEYFASFLPAISDAATKEIRAEIRKWKLPRRSDKSVDDLARMFNPKIRGWVQYYGRYYRSQLYRVFAPLDHLLVGWACRKYKRLRHHRTRGFQWLHRLAQRAPRLWAHWEVGVKAKVA